MHKVPLLCGTSFKASLSPWVKFSLTVMWYIYIHTHICNCHRYLYLSITLTPLQDIIRDWKKKNKKDKFFYSVFKRSWYRQIQKHKFHFFCTWIHHAPQQHLMSVAVHVSVQLQKLLICRYHWKHHWITVSLLHE